MTRSRNFYVPTEQMRLIREHPLARGLKAFWLLTPRHGLVDLVARIPLTKNGAVGLDGRGQRGPGSKFNGGYWAAPSCPATKISTSSISLAAGIRTGTNDGVGKVIIGQPAGSSHADPYFYYTLFWNCYTGIDKLNFRLDYTYCEGGSMGGSNAEYSCMGTYDGATMTAYLNGASVATTARTGAVLSNTQDLRLGANRAGNETFNGTTYYAAIWDVARSAHDAVRMHRTPFAMLEPDRKRRSVVVSAAASVGIWKLAGARSRLAGRGGLAA